MRKGPRFIPAWAGNSDCDQGYAGSSPVHPRMGGEQLTDFGLMTMGIGSSPHGRGTESRSSFYRLRGRFIPAWAGNSTEQGNFKARRPVHPRMGGEQTSCNHK